MSNRIYSPALWQGIKLTHEGKDIYKILGTWYGGYGGSDSWRLSSGVVSINEIDEDHYEVINHSGSTYICHKKAEGMGGYTSSIYAGFCKQADESNGKFKIELVSIDELLTNFPSSNANS